MEYVSKKRIKTTVINVQQVWYQVYLINLY